MRYLLLLLLCLAATLGRAQDVLKMIDGTEKQVKLIEVLDTKVVYFELGDPLALEHDMPRSRVTKIIHEDGFVENLRKEQAKQGLTIVRAQAPDSTKEAVIMKTGEEIPAKILAIEPTTVHIRRRTGPKAGYQERIRRDAIKKLRYADGKELDVAREEAESVRTNGRQLFDFTDPASPDLFLRSHMPSQTARSHGRLYTPEEMLSFKSFSTIKEAVANRADVRFLDLHGLQLTALPPEVITLRRLVGLDLSQNPIGSFPDELLLMPNLQYIWIDSCGLTDLIPKLDPKAKSNLIFISAKGNKLKEISPELAELPSLYMLRLKHNQIHTVSGKVFEAAPGKPSSLSGIDLASNGLEHMPVALGSLPYLRYLSCRGNQIKEPTLGLGVLDKLTELDMGQNSFTRFDGTVLTLPHLASLYLDGEPQAGKGLAVPTTLPDNLTYADVTGLPGSAAVALALKVRNPKLRVRYYSGLMGKVQESEPFTAAADAATAYGGLYTVAQGGEADPAMRLAKHFTDHHDYGMALAALSAHSGADTADSERLRLEQARLLSLPATQPYLADGLTVRDCQNPADCQAWVAKCRSLRMLRALCATANGKAAQEPCREAAALLRRASTGLERLAASVPDPAAYKAEAAKLNAEAAAMEAR